jgi:hypothetical protein
MHEPLLSQAALPAPVSVCGIPLRPYSLGHELFLIRERNGFMFDFDEQGRRKKTLPEVFHADIFEAVWICSSTFEECRSAYSSWLYLPKLWLLKRKVQKCDVAAEAQAFRDYRDSGNLEFPMSDIREPSKGKDAARTPGAPFILRLNQFLITHCRKTEEQAWDYPVGLAKMRWAALWEQEGGLRLYNEENAKIDAMLSAATEEAKCQA